MAIAFDAATESVRTDTADPHTWTHTPVGTPKAILVTAVHGVNSTDSVSTITYGGVTMVRLRRATDTVTEPGAAEIWGLFTGIPTGAQTVSVDLTSATTDDFQFVSLSFTASSNVGVVSSQQIDENVANPSVNMNHAGLTCIDVGVLYGGGAAPGGTIQAGCERVFGEDLGNFYADVIRLSTPSSGNPDVGFSTLTSDDVAFVCVAIGETVAASTLSDNFDDNSINTTIWSDGTNGAGSTVTESSQRINQAPAASTADAEGYLVYKDFSAKFDLTGGEFYVNLVQTLNANAGTETAFTVIFNDFNWVRFMVGLSPATLHAQKMVANSLSTITSTTYNSSTHAWLKIRESGGTTYFDISSDGSSWSNFTSLANPMPVTSTYPKMNAYAGNVASPGTAQWDSFNTAPAAPAATKKLGLLGVG